MNSSSSFPISPEFKTTTLLNNYNGIFILEAENSLQSHSSLRKPNVTFDTGTKTEWDYIKCDEATLNLMEWKVLLKALDKHADKPESVCETR